MTERLTDPLSPLRTFRSTKRKVMQELYSDVTDQATRMAFTESLQATETVRYSSARAGHDTGQIRVKKVWFTMGDSLVRSTHAAVSGQSRFMRAARTGSRRRGERIRSTFRVGGSNLEFPRQPGGEPGEIINCRCFLEYRRTRRQQRFDQGPSTTTQDLQRVNRQRLDRATRKPQPWDGGDNPAIRRAAKKKYDAAIKIEPEITGILDEVAEQTGAKFALKSERVKFQASTQEKIQRQMIKRPKLTPTESADKIWDANRYTMTWDAKDPLWRTKMLQAEKAMNDAGWKTIKNANAWIEGYSYNGMNYNFQNAAGQIIELQFHTPQSILIKDVSHKVYQTLKTLPDGDPRRQPLIKRIVRLWADDRSHVPSNVASLGTPTPYPLS